MFVSLFHFLLSRSVFFRSYIFYLSGLSGHIFNGTIFFNIYINVFSSWLHFFSYNFCLLFLISFINFLNKKRIIIEIKLELMQHNSNKLLFTSKQNLDVCWSLRILSTSQSLNYVTCILPLYFI